MTRLPQAAVPIVSESVLARTALRLSDYITLSKPRIAVLELVVVAICAYLANPSGLLISTWSAMLVGTALVAASASALNQWLEQATDARMPRTKNRPLPAGRLGRNEVLLLASLSVVMGTILLWFYTRPIAAGFALASWFIYVCVYTPMKRRSALNTAVGAVSGALPVLIGWTAVGGSATDLAALAIAAIVFVWQFPHFMAIAWLYRSDYAAGGMKMLSVTDPTGFACGRQAVAGALALLPVSLVPVLMPWASNVAIYTFWALLLGFAQAALAGHFLIQRNDTSARWLLRASLVYLPCVLGLLLLTR